MVEKRREVTKEPVMDVEREAQRKDGRIERNEVTGKCYLVWEEKDG